MVRNANNLGSRPARSSLGSRLSIEILEDRDLLSALGPVPPLVAPTPAGSAQHAQVAPVQTGQSSEYGYGAPAAANASAAKGNAAPAAYPPSPNQTTYPYTRGDSTDDDASYATMPSQAVNSAITGQIALVLAERAGVQESPSVRPQNVAVAPSGQPARPSEAVPTSTGTSTPPAPAVSLAGRAPANGTDIGPVADLAWAAVATVGRLEILANIAVMDQRPLISFGGEEATIARGVSTALAGSAPINLAQLERTLDALFAQVKNLEWSPFEDGAVRTLTPWLVAAAAAAAAAELRRRTPRGFGAMAPSWALGRTPLLRRLPRTAS